MKKLLYILLLTTFTMNFTACSDDDNTNNEPPLEFDDWNDVRSENYKPEGYNPILGHWHYTKQNATMKIVFTEDFYEKSGYKNENEEWILYSKSYKYIINNKQIRVNRLSGQIFYWEITKEDSRDVLTISNSKGENPEKYYREQ